MIETLCKFLSKDRFTLGDDMALIDALRQYVFGFDPLYTTELGVNADLTSEEMLEKTRTQQRLYESTKRIPYCGLSEQQKVERRAYQRTYQKARRAKRKLQKEATP